MNGISDVVFDGKSWNNSGVFSFNKGYPTNGMTLSQIFYNLSSSFSKVNEKYNSISRSISILEFPHIVNINNADMISFKTLMGTEIFQTWILEHDGYFSNLIFVDSAEYFDFNTFIKDYMINSFIWLT